MWSQALDLLRTSAYMFGCRQLWVDSRYPMLIAVKFIERYS